MYRWMIYAHIAGVLGFFMMQGGTLSAMFRLRQEDDPERIAALLSLARLASRWSILPLLIIVLSGATLGFIGRWWGYTWIWLALGLLVLLASLGFTISRAYGERIRANLRVEFGNPSITTRFDPSLKTDQIKSILASGHPTWLALISAAGLMLLLWLMIFKPF
jgi:hypothetical protein